MSDQDNQDEPLDEEPDVDFEDDEDAFSLEELGAAYKHIVAKADAGTDAVSAPIGEVLQREYLLAAQASDQQQTDDEAADADVLNAPTSADDSDDEADETWAATNTGEQTSEIAATPEAIIESALFVGNPTGQGITATRLASIMRDMTPEEVTQTINQLNDSYRTHRQGIRIAEDDTGYRLVVAPEVESMRHVFTGKVRETRLSQGAIEVLSLVAYQPGITAMECTDRRGRESLTLLNQMVRRRLVDMKREPESTAPPAPAAVDAGADPKAKKAAKTKIKLVSKFYPAERLLVLLGLESLDDLPQVEETHMQ